MAKWAIQRLAGQELRPADHSDWHGRTFAATFDHQKDQGAPRLDTESSREVLIKRGIHDPIDELPR